MGPLKQFSHFPCLLSIFLASVVALTLQAEPNSRFNLKPGQEIIVLRPEVQSNSIKPGVYELDHYDSREKRLYVVGHYEHAIGIQKSNIVKSVPSIKTPTGNVVEPMSGILTDSGYYNAIAVGEDGGVLYHLGNNLFNARSSGYTKKFVSEVPAALNSQGEMVTAGSTILHNGTTKGVLAVGEDGRVVVEGARRISVQGPGDSVSFIDVQIQEVIRSSNYVLEDVYVKKDIQGVESVFHEGKKIFAFQKLGSESQNLYEVRTGETGINNSKGVVWAETPQLWHVTDVLNTQNKQVKPDFGKLTARNQTYYFEKVGKDRVDVDVKDAKGQWKYYQWSKSQLLKNAQRAGVSHDELAKCPLARIAVK